MERDFMGLNSKNSAIVVKEEAIEGCKDSGFFKGLPAQWPLANAFDPSNKHQSGEIKNMNENRQVGTQFSMTPYPGQQNLHSMLLPHEVKMVPRTNQASAAATSVNLNNPFFMTHFGGGGGGAHNYAGQQQQQPMNGVAGTTEPWFNPKASRAPAQLTIFYGGTVQVFDAISPEKAQAIMFLAGNGALGACNIGQTRAQVQTPTSNMGQPINTPPCSAISSPISVSSHPPVGNSAGGPTNNDGPTKITGLDAPKIATSVAHVTATTVIPSAVPQARKASLARFLEKRKERAMCAAPYSPSKNNGEGTTFPGGSNGVGFSGMGSRLISTANDS